MSIKSATAGLVLAFQSRPTVRAGSLIITVFGDAIAPRGGTVWIGSLIRALEDFGISERLVRTSVFRLSRDGWLDVEQLGRRSYYSLTAEGARKFEQATHRIYGEPRQAWDGVWSLVLLAGLAAADRDKVRKELSWMGFGAIAPGVLGHPSDDSSAVEAALAPLGLDGGLVVMRGRSAGSGQDAAMRELVHRSWNLDEIDRRYAEFVAQFRPAFAAASKAGMVDPRDAFQIRTLLIQEYRKILLRDPLLPAQLLPQSWHGTAAYQLCRNLYRAVCGPADEFMSEAMETADGPLPPPDPTFYDRFGGLN